ncbi:MAG: hypothetical protein IJ695_10820 [Butyrivibrio sp.]|nr:hypothetical protein [Butyrivibrio sp.]
MNKALENRIIQIPDNIVAIRNETRRILDGILRWTGEKDFMQLRLLLPRLMNLISKIDAQSKEIDECISTLEGEKNADLTRDLLLQQKALLSNERSIIEKIRDDVSLSSRLIEKSEQMRLTGEILERCKALELSVKELR